MSVLLWMKSPLGTQVSLLESVEDAMGQAVILERDKGFDFYRVETSDSVYYKSTEEYQKAVKEASTYKPKWLLGIERGDEFIKIEQFSHHFPRETLDLLTDLTKEFPSHKFVVKEA